jgi:UDP-glucose 4-epimerase
MNNSKKNNILILGGSGFIGKGIIKELLSRNYCITATYYKHPPKDTFSSKLKWIKWDATSQPLPDIAWQEIDTILHLANCSNIHNFPSNSRSIYKIVVESTFNILEKAYQHGVSRFILSSTGDVLSKKNICNQENADYGPTSFYATSKACAEMITNSYASLISTAILRFYHPYGPGSDRFLIFRLVRNVAEGKEITIEGKDGIIINPIYITDLGEGVALAIESEADGKFHLAGPDQISLRDFLELVGDMAGKKPKIRSLPAKSMGGHAGNFTRSNTILGFTPTISLKDGLEKLFICYEKWKRINEKN